MFTVLGHAVRSALAVIRARNAHPPASLREAVERAEDDLTDADDDGWIRISGPSKRRWADHWLRPKD